MAPFDNDFLLLMPL